MPVIGIVYLPTQRRPVLPTGIGESEAHNRKMIIALFSSGVAIPGSVIPFLAHNFWSSREALHLQSADRNLVLVAGDTRMLFNQLVHVFGYVGGTFREITNCHYNRLKMRRFFCRFKIKRNSGSVISAYTLSRGYTGMIERDPSKAWRSQPSLTNSAVKV